MNGLNDNQTGFTLAEIIVAVFLLIVLAIGLHFVTHRGHPANNTSKVGNSTTTSTSSAVSNSRLYSTLSPANVPPKAPECHQQLTFSSNGDPAPLTCNEGEINVLAWNALAALEPSVFNLGYNATAAQVQASLCADVKANISNPIEESSYQIAALYYGWSLTPNPSIVLTNGTCSNLDD
jgi:Tfp pilus assembly protein PilV